MQKQNAAFLLSPLRFLRWGLPLILVVAACSEGEEEPKKAPPPLSGMLDVLEEKAFHITEELPEEWRDAAKALLQRGAASKPQALALAPSGGQEAAGIDALLDPLPAGMSGRSAGALVPGHGVALPDIVPDFTPPPLEPSPSLEDWPFVPGEAVVRLADASAEAVASLHEQVGLEDYRFEILAHGTAEIVSLRIVAGGAPERPIGPDETREVAARLAEHPRLRYAHLNYLRRTFAEPNDPFYPLQWHLRQLNMEAAWEMSTGSSQVVVAVLDSGVKAHEDLGDRLLPGYDMVASVRMAGDGDGRDGDPSPVRGRAWHGQHVAGTIGAATNNGNGIAGVDWGCNILPVRVMGLTGWGTSIDVVAGIHWAVGGKVPGVPANPHPAHVLNLSLGGGSMVAAEQEAVDAAVRAGALVVVAAGNENMDARDISFAGYQNVLTVGASDINGYRAPYSNFGPAVDVMAPGGNISQDINGDGYPDGVLSLYFDWRGEESAFIFLQGTSMAAPHVAGVAALLKAIDPNLGPADLKRILRDSAHSQGTCAEGCGKGLLNPVRALSMAGGGGSTEPRLSVSADRVELGRSRRGQLFISNGGGGSLEWSASVHGAKASHFDLGKRGGKVDSGGSETLEILANREGLQDGTYEATLVIKGANSERRVALSFTVREKLPDVGTVWVGLVSWTEEGELHIASAASSDLNNGYAWKLPPAAGSWTLMAVADRDGDGAFGSGDMVGFWRNWEDRQPIDLDTSPQLTELDFPLRPYMIKAPYRADGAVGSACDHANPCQAPYSCDLNAVNKGICTRVCSQDGKCPGGFCVSLTREVAICLPPCDDEGECPRDGFSCMPLRSGYDTCFPPF